MASAPLKRLPAGAVAVDDRRFSEADGLGPIEANLWMVPSGPCTRFPRPMASAPLKPLDPRIWTGTVAAFSEADGLGPIEAQSSA